VVRADPTRSASTKSNREAVSHKKRGTKPLEIIEALIADDKSLLITIMKSTKREIWAWTTVLEVQEICQANHRMTMRSNSPCRTLRKLHRFLRSHKISKRIMGLLRKKSILLML
jgi:hypothetical protein